MAGEVVGKRIHTWREAMEGLEPGGRGRTGFFHGVEKNGFFFHTMEKFFGNFPHNGKKFGDFSTERETG
jgi:hypothetical protein